MSKGKEHCDHEMDHPRDDGEDLVRCDIPLRALHVAGKWICCDDNGTRPLAIAEYSVCRGGGITHRMPWCGVGSAGGVDDNGINSSAWRGE